MPIYEVESFDDLVEGQPVIEQLDALYMTRIQKEHNDPRDAESFAKIDFFRYCLNPELVARMKEYAPILHPFRATSISAKFRRRSTTTRGPCIFARLAMECGSGRPLLAHVFDVDHQITRHFRGVYRELHHYNETAV